ncbi:MAG: hypothetical protein FJ225_06545 [Lentisphaerae bacterium]|nr:hypothetical protein [Lentisphaerota bacterium]
MPKLKIDNRETQAPEGATVLEAARSLGIEIPTLCHVSGAPHFTGCMVCLVSEASSGRLLPACTAPATEGCVIETATPAVREARRAALGLLLSDHLGDCEGPCARVCPSGINIPLMIRRIGAGALAEAGRVAAASELPRCCDPERGCAAPCERVCRRNQIDQAVSIRLLCRFAVGRLPEGHEPPNKADVRGARRFNSVIGRLREEEKRLMMEGVDPAPRVTPSAGEAAGFAADEAAREAGRCMRCDCRKPETCLLRRYAGEYGVKQNRYKPRERRVFERDTSHPDLVFEPGKCIGCGICVHTARAHGEPLGLSFTGRGMRTRIGVPFGEPLSKGLTVSARAVVEACPTGAFAWRGGEDEQ